MINVFTNYIGKEDEAREKFKEFPEILCTKTNIEKLSQIELPIRQTEFAAAYDLSLPYSITIFPGETRKLFFGWKLSLLDIDGDSTDFVQGVVLARSSLAKKKGLILEGDYSLIYDNDYVIASFKNFTKEAVLIEEGERIAQICFIHQFKVIKDHKFDCFEKVSSSSIEYDIPLQKGKYFAFQATEDTEILPGKVTLFLTELKCNLKEYEVLFIKSTIDNENIVLSNGIGVVDADYYNNETNEGEIGFLFLNQGYVPYTIRKGTILGKGWIDSYLTLRGDKIGGKRTGGFGSTSES